MNAFRFWTMSRLIKSSEARGGLASIDEPIQLVHGLLTRSSRGLGASF